MTLTEGQIARVEAAAIRLTFARGSEHRWETADKDTKRESRIAATDALTAADEPLRKRLDELEKRVRQRYANRGLDYEGQDRLDDLRDIRLLVMPALDQATPRESE
jgi:hypothetical protein